MTTTRTVDDVVCDAHRLVGRLERQLVDAMADRDRTFALAQRNHRRTAGEISRLLGPAVRPEKVSASIRIGRRLLELDARQDAGGSAAV